MSAAEENTRRGMRMAAGPARTNISIKNDASIKNVNTNTNTNKATATGGSAKATGGSSSSKATAKAGGPMMMMSMSMGGMVSIPPGMTGMRPMRAVEKDMPRMKRKPARMLKRMQMGVIALDRKVMKVKRRRNRLARMTRTGGILQKRAAKRRALKSGMKMRARKFQMQVNKFKMRRMRLDKVIKRREARTMMRALRLRMRRKNLRLGRPKMSMRFRRMRQISRRMMRKNMAPPMIMRMQKGVIALGRKR